MSLPAPPPWDRAKQYYPPVDAPDIEFVAQIFFTSLISPIPVVTRLPQPAATQATFDTLLRIEASHSIECDNTFGAAFDCTFLMHAYSPNEVEAAQLSILAAAHARAATGLSVGGWYVVSVPHAISGKRLSDPNVPTNMVRYRSAITWRVAGRPPAEN